MNAFLRVPATLVLLSLLCLTTNATPRAGFYLPDSVTEVTMRYRHINNLIVLPVIINDSIRLNLILDTGCRNLVLFGKKFQRLLRVQPAHKIQFSGLGSGKPITGGLSLNNKVSIGAVLGENIPIVIIPDRNIFESYQMIHGVIGYEVFLRFEIELNPLHERISFRPAHSASLPLDFIKIPLRIEDSRPLIDCRVMFNEYSQYCNLMIDTGSSLGLLIKTSTTTKIHKGKRIVLGKGFNGNIEGVQIISKKLIMNDLEITNVNTGVIYSPWHDYASIGMDLLKDYSLILNYYKAYAGLKKIS